MGGLSLGTLGARLCCFIHTLYCLCQRWRCCVKPPFNKVTAGKSASETTPFNFCELVCNETSRHRFLHLCSSSPLKRFFNQNKQEESGHEIMLPLLKFSNLRIMKGRISALQHSSRRPKGQPVRKSGWKHKTAFKNLLVSVFGSLFKAN